MASSPASRILSSRIARMSGSSLDRVDQIAAPDDDARLRPAEQLVAAEQDEVGAGGDGVAASGSGDGKPNSAVGRSAPEPISSITGSRGGGRSPPTAGVIAAGLDPARHARAYVAGGARAVSVLTDAVHFGGSLEDLRDVRAAVGVPVLRKDFIIDPIQVYESRAAGASAILLIVRALGVAQLRELAAVAVGLGLARLVEVHTAEESNT